MKRSRWFIPVVAMSAVLLVVAAAVAGIFVGMMIERDRGDGGVVKPRVIGRVFIKVSATPGQVMALEAKIKATPGIESYEYVSQYEAFKRLMRTIKKEAQPIFKNLTSNPLPASFEIKVNDASQVKAIEDKLSGNPAIDDDVPGAKKHGGVDWGCCNRRGREGS